MHVLEYEGLDTTGLVAAYDKTVEQLKRGDWRSAQVKKLSPTPYYRARLDHTNRLLFQLWRHGDVPCLLALEIIRNHGYDKSRFLRGTLVDEAKLPELPAPEEPVAALPALPAVASPGVRFHVLDKVLLFDAAQEAVFQLRPPLVIVGGAGSGKTALTLEKMKQLGGQVLYTTQSAFLAQHARGLYFANGFEPADQEPEFLSFRELLETVRVAPGRELTSRDFRDFLSRHRQALGPRDGHMLYEEFRGVLAGSRTERPYLGLDDYLALGVRQSIFPSEERPAVYALFERYLAWMRDAGLHDSSILAQQYLALTAARYDFVVVDEVQDLTIAQLALCLKLLRSPGQFVLCGDANQIVHPNFFSWAQVKTLFWQDATLAEGAPLHVLRANYRNTAHVTRLANRLIKLKQRRFGSIDRESNFLVESRTAGGGVTFLPDQDKIKRELDEKTRQSARFAVIVLREEAKEEARRHFRTPLVFSVQEAKGLEYDHIILFNLVSGARQAFAAIAEGIARSDLDGDELAYARARDKSDKSLEAYKFFINALYVAVTRAVQHLYVIESDPRHPLLGLLELERTEEKLELSGQRSSAEEWQREARRLELQGRQEQADEIRSKVLRQQQVPWPVFDGTRFAQLRQQVLDPKNVSSKARQQLMELAAFHREPRLFARLSGVQTPDPAMLDRAGAGAMQKYAASYAKAQFKDILGQTEQYGVDFRNVFNCTPLMMAARAGNVALAEALLKRGASAEAVDNYGRNAFQSLLDSATRGQLLAAGRFVALYRLLAPAAVSLRYADRLYKLDQRSIEFVLYNVCAATAKSAVQDEWRYGAGINTDWVIEVLEPWPAAILPPERKRRQYLSGVLSRNEVYRDYPYNRRLFLRMRHGEYALNPLLDVRMGEAWVNICEVLQYERIAEGADAQGASFLAAVLEWREQLAKSGDGKAENKIAPRSPELF